MPLTESVRLDIDQAEAAIARLQADIAGLSSTRRIDLEIDVDETPLRSIDERLDSIEANVADVNRDVADIAVSAGRSTAEFEAMARALGVSEDEARQLADEILQADRAARQIDDAARDVASALGLADDDARRFANEMARASRETRDTDQAMDRLSASAVRVRAAIAGAVVAFGVRGLVNAAGDAIESFNALNESVNAVEQVFEEGADTVFKFGENVAQTAGLARGEFQQAVVPIGALLRNFGFDANQAADAAVTLTQRAADLASVFNTDVQTAIEAIAAGLRGEANPMERFGAGLSAARVEAKALELGLAATKAEITDLDKVTARYQLILSDTAKVQGDFQRTLEDPANAARALAAAAENARAALGERLIPAYLTILEVAPDVIAAFEDIGPAVETVATSFANSSDEIADFAVATLNVLATLPLQVEILVAQAKTLPEGFLQTLDLIRGVSNETEILKGNFDDIAGEVAGVTDRTRTLNNLYSQLDLIIAIQDGVEPLRALRDAISAVAGEAGDLDEVFADFVRTSGLGGSELRSAIVSFIENASGLRLTAEDIEFLLLQLRLLRGEASGLNFDRGAFGDLRRGIEEIPPVVDDGIVSLQELQAAAREAGLGIAEALSDTELFPAGTVFSIFAEAEAEVATFRDRVNEIGRDIDPLKGAVDALEISRAEFVANLQEAFGQEVEFEANLARLGNRGFDALAESLRALGPGANALVVDFLNNAADAAAAEDVLDATGNRFAEGVADSLRDEFRSSIFTGLPAELARELAQAFETDPGTGFDSLAEKQARAIRQGLTVNGVPEMQGAGQDLADESTAAFADRVAELAPEVGFDAALDLARALTTGEAAAAATQAGIDWAALFSAAVSQGVSFDFTAPNIPTPTQAPTGGGTLEGPGTSVRSGGTSVIINNPQVTDLPTALTQAEQAAQTIGVLLN